MNNLAHNLSGISVPQRVADGYINATALTAAHKQATGQRKDVADWLRNKRVQQSLEHLSLAARIPVIDLYQVFQGSPELGGGTWLHPKLSVRFAIWLSDDFGYQIESWVEDWMLNAKVPIAQQVQTQPQALPVIMPTEEELAYMRSRAWEKEEMKSWPVPAKNPLKRSGYRRAIDVMKDMQQKSLDESEEIW